MTGEPLDSNLLCLLYAVDRDHQYHARTAGKHIDKLKLRIYSYDYNYLSSWVHGKADDDDANLHLLDLTYWIPAPGTL